MTATHPDLRVELGPLSLKNPVMTASGTFGYGEEYASLVDLNCLGALIVKGLSLRPIPGNPSPRIVETPCGMLNAIGLANIGLRAFLDDELEQIDEFEEEKTTKAAKSYSATKGQKRFRMSLEKKKKEMTSRGK